MCGICGYAGFERDEQLLKRMAAVIAHRGPDDEGFFWVDRVGLGMRRLSIIDIAGGQQPILNEDGTIAIIFNGEIYNYKTLVEHLIQRGHLFRTRSDTETILHLYEEYGSECVQHLRGMFAFAIYDTRHQQLFLARDRMGIKPLYYWSQQGKLLFGSEIKAILECNHVSTEPYLPAIDAYLSLRYVPGPETLFTGIYKLPAAHWLLWQDGQICVKRYWTPHLYTGSYKPDSYYQERFVELFSESVRLRLMSEVPLGSFLSGGVDSAAITTTMRHFVDQPVKSFSVGFNWPGDELSTAKEVAQKLGCDHSEIICQPEDFAHLPKAIWHLDEPVGDAIIVPMYLLSRLARQQVTVVLTGDGADETLAGYLPHKVMVWARHYARWMPQFMQRRVVQPLVEQLPSAMLGLAFDYPAELGVRGKRKVVDYLSLVGSQQPEAEYNFLISLFDSRDKIELYTTQLHPFINPRAVNGNLPSYPHQGIHYLDQVLSLQFMHWLPDDILMKQDKLTMAHSIEARVPFLDHHLVEFLLQTPPHLKLRGLTNKILLRNYVAQALPGKAAHRSKKPFYIPLEQYFTQGPLSEIVATCLSKQSIQKRGYFVWDKVQTLRQAVNNKDFLFGKQIFALTALELWHRIFIDREKGWL